MSGAVLARFPRGEGGLGRLPDSHAYQIARKAALYSEEAIDVLVELMRASKRSGVRMDCAKAILTLAAHAPGDAHDEARRLVVDADPAEVAADLMGDGG